MIRMVSTCTKGVKCTLIFVRSIEYSEVYLVLPGRKPEGKVLVTELRLEKGTKVVKGVLTTSLVEKDLVESGPVHGRVEIVLITRLA